MWRRAVSGDRWELAQVVIVSLATTTFVSLALAMRSGWVTASLAAASMAITFLCALVLSRRRQSAYVRRHAVDGLRSMEAMLAVAATVEDEHSPDVERGEG